MQIDVDPEQDFHVVIDGVVTALSLDGLDAAYQADKISDDTLIWQDGLDEWMRLDALLAALGEQEPEQEAAAPHVPEPTADAGSYSVLVAPNDIQNMSLDVLADAYRRGVVNDHTLVWQVGATDWIALSVVIAGFAANQQASQAPAPAPMQQSGPSVPAPMQHSVPPTQMLSTPVVVQAPHVAPSALASAPNTLAPTAANISPMFPGGGVVGRPDLALDDLDVSALKGGSGATWLKRSLVAMGALGCVALVYQVSGGSGGQQPSQTSGVAAPAVSAAATPEVEAEPTAWEKEQALVEKARLADEAAAKAAANRPAADAFGARLTGEDKAKKVTPPRPKGRSTNQAKKKSSAASSNAGSGEYDPMNGAL